MRQSSVVETACAVKGKSVLAEVFLQKMRGGAGSVLVGASDGHEYVIKSTENRQGPNVVFNECLATLLASKLGLPVPRWAAVRVPKSLIEQHWAAWRGHSSTLPQPGLYFGSEYLRPCSGRQVYQIIPPEWVGRIVNRLDFVAMLAFDIWTENRDRRQALFVCTEGSQDLDALFFDYGHCFQGPDGNSPLRAEWACLYYLMDVYSGLFTDENISIWVRQVDSLGADTIGTMVSGIPDEWKSGIDTAAVTQRLIMNRKKLRSRMEWARTMLTREMAMTTRQHEKRQSWLRLAEANYGELTAG